MSKTRRLTQIGVLSALAIVLMLFSIPLPFMPEFLRLDLAELPALIGLFTLGPWGAVMVELIKNLIHLTTTRTVGIGEFANFIVGSSLVLGTYQGLKRELGLWLSLGVGVITMTVVAALTNLFILIPLYAWYLGIPMESLISLGNKANSRIIDLTSFILWGIVPFNLLKGCLVAVSAASVFPRIKRWMKSKDSF